MVDAIPWVHHVDAYYAKRFEEDDEDGRANQGGDAANNKDDDVTGHVRVVFGHSAAGHNTTADDELRDGQHAVTVPIHGRRYVAAPQAAEDAKAVGGSTLYEIESAKDLGEWSPALLLDPAISGYRRERDDAKATHFVEGWLQPLLSAHVHQTDDGVLAQALDRFVGVEGTGRAEQGEQDRLGESFDANAPYSAAARAAAAVCKLISVLDADHMERTRKAFSRADVRRDAPTKLTSPVPSWEPLYANIAPSQPVIERALLHLLLFGESAPESVTLACFRHGCLAPCHVMVVAVNDSGGAVPDATHRVLTEHVHGAALQAPLAQANVASRTLELRATDPSTGAAAAATPPTSLRELAGATDDAFDMGRNLLHYVRVTIAR